jgi:hypothetical protein
MNKADKNIYLVWQFGYDSEPLAVQAYKTKRGAKSAVKNYRRLHPDSPSTFAIQKDKVSVPFGTDGFWVDPNL